MKEFFWKVINFKIINIFRMISVMRTKLGQNVEEMLERWYSEKPQRIHIKNLNQGQCSWEVGPVERNNKQDPATPRAPGLLISDAWSR